MIQTLHDGQCGLCTRFGAQHAKSDVLVSILTSTQANPDLTDECGYLKLALLHLQVMPISGCDGYAPAAANESSCKFPLRSPRASRRH